MPTLAPHPQALTTARNAMLDAPSPAATRSPLVRVLRGVLGFALGVVTALAMLIAVELFSAVVHPFPEGFDNSPDAMCRHVANYPGWVLAVVVPMWALVAWAASGAARGVGGRGAAGVLALLLLLAVVFNVSMLPYPLWFRVLAVLAVGLGGAMAWRAPNPNRDANPA